MSFDIKYYTEKYNEQVSKVNVKQMNEMKKTNQFIDNLKIEKEFHSWALLINQSWLNQFYNTAFWNIMSFDLLKYKYTLSSENIILETCEVEGKKITLGYYLKSKDKIVLCSNFLTNFNKRNLFDYTLKRQLIFLYDSITNKNYDFKNCNHLACSEIRAANLNNVCLNSSYTYLNIIMRRGRSNRNSLYYCVKNTSLLNLANDFPHCEEKAVDYIDKMFDKCITNMAPTKSASVRLVQYL